MARRVIALLGRPELNEDGAADEAITPGHLVDGVTIIGKHATANGPGRSFALERDERGQGIDVAYASGDYVKVGAFAGGMRVYAWLKSGENVAADAYLGSQGDGTLKAWASGPYLGRSLEAVNATAGDTRIRVEVN